MNVLNNNRQPFACYEAMAVSADRAIEKVKQG